MSFTLCHQCDRGGLGNATDKCACGWQVERPSDAGCYLGTPIIGEPKPQQERSAQFRRLFPKLCKPRKVHHCRLCGGSIGIAELCCSWSSLEPGEGYSQSYAHPECYDLTISEDWDSDVWESCTPGDISRPKKEARP